MRFGILLLLSHHINIPSRNQFISSNTAHFDCKQHAMLSTARTGGEIIKIAMKIACIKLAEIPVLSLGFSATSYIKALISYLMALPFTFFIILSQIYFL